MFQEERKKKEPYLQICRYTESIWKKMFPDRPLEMWREETRPYNFRGYLQRLLYGLEEYLNYDTNAIEKLLITPVDEEYLYYLKENGIEPTAENMQENVQYYVQEIEEKNSLRLLKKNNMDISVTPMCISMHVLLPKEYHNGRTEFKPKEETVRLVKELTDRIYKADTYVLPYYILSNEIGKETARLTDIGTAYFLDGIKVSYGMYDTQYLHDKRVNFIGLCIPFFIFDRMDTAEIEIDSQVFRRSGKFDFSGIDKDIVFADKGDKKLPAELKPVGSLTGTPLEAAIQSDMPDCKVDITVQPFETEQVRVFEEEVLRMATKALSKLK